MTDDLTPEAVKAALDGATPGPWRAHCDEHGYTGEVHGGIGSEHEGCIADWVPSHDAFLIALAPDLARDWLRLKKVEEAGKELDAVIRTAARKAQAGQVNTAIEWLLSSVRELEAFRAAVEGK